MSATRIPDSGANENLEPSVVTAEATSLTRPYSFLSLSTGIAVPCVGYSFFKTPDRTAECVNLALATGVRHFDCATQYQNNVAIGETLARATPVFGIDRSDLFLTHKLSNDEQSSNKKKVKHSVKNALHDLQTTYLDLCMLHSPLTNKNRRLASYEALVELCHEGLVKSFGVCNFGVQPLQELIDASLPSPAVIQLQLSPFNQHKEVVKWANSNGSALACSAWSRLSGVDGPAEGWSVVANLAQKKSLTKAQVLVRWAMQKGYICVPRSSAASRLERQAIFENSFQSCSTFALSAEEMTLIDGLDIQLPAGQLRAADGYEVQDIVSRSWDPTTAVV